MPLTHYEKSIESHLNARRLYGDAQAEPAGDRRVALMSDAVSSEERSRVEWGELSVPR